MYNQSSEPYFSVAEYWDGTPGNLRSYLESASYNTTVFDFPLKYKFNANIGKGSYSGMKNAGLRSIGLQKYAVTFIDNHDTSSARTTRRTSSSATRRIWWRTSRRSFRLTLTC
jgi:hypothetical protein